jgi:hypothetical protein
MNARRSSGIDGSHGFSGSQSDRHRHGSKRPPRSIRVAAAFARRENAAVAGEPHVAVLEGGPLKCDIGHAGAAGLGLDDEARPVSRPILDGGVAQLVRAAES